MRVAANVIIMLAGAYLMHELINQRQTPCPGCVRARVNVVPDERAGADQAAREGQDTGWKPRIIRAAAYAPGTGD